MRKLLSIMMCVALMMSMGIGAATADRLVDEDVTITYMRSEHANQPITETAAVLDWIYEATGIRIDLMPVAGSDYTQKCTTMIASDTMTDIMDTVPNYTVYAAENMFVPISDYFDQMPEYKAFVDSEIDNMSKMFVNDKLYCVIHAGQPNNTSMGQEPMIRGDILEELGLEMPDNFDELLEVLRAFKAAYPESYPWCVRGGINNLTGISGYMMGYGNGWYYDKDLNGGEWAYGFTSENFIKGLEFIATCYAEGILDPDYANCTAAQWQEKCSTGVCLYTFDNPTFNINYNLALQAEDPNAAFTYVPVMENWSGQRRGLRYTNSWYDSPTVISASSDKIDTCIKLLNWDYTEEGKTITNWGKEGVTYEIVGGEKKLLDSVVEAAMLTSDPWRGFMGAYGLGHLGLATCVDESTQNTFLSESTLEWYAYWANEEALAPAVIAPVFTDEEQSRLADLKTAVNTLYESEIDKYITGVEPVANIVNLQNRLLEAGVTEALEIYNTAESRS